MGDVDVVDDGCRVLMLRLPLLIMMLPIDDDVDDDDDDGWC